MELYRWQKDCLARWKQNGGMGIVHVITGAGKTVAALAGIHLLESDLHAQDPDASLRVFVITPTIAIARQWVKALRADFPPENGHENRRIGIWYGEEKDPGDCFCRVYVVNSARHALSGQVIRLMQSGHPVLLIADECHHYGSRENAKIFDFQTSPSFDDALYYAMGLSATPRCAHFEDVLVPALGEEIYWYTLHQAIHEETVSPFVTFRVAVGFTGKEAKQYGDLSTLLHRTHAKLLRAYPSLAADAAAFFPRVQALAEELGTPESLPRQYLNLVRTRRNLCLSATNRLRCAASIIRRQRPGSRILIFCERIDQAEHVQAWLREQLPFQTGLYHSGLTPDRRREVLRDFRDGVIRVLVTCKALDEGVDVPDALVGIVISSTLTERQRIQRLGRILRRAEGKNQAILYYLYVNKMTDEMTYLGPEDEGRPTADLLFSAGADTFDCPLYAACARQVLLSAQEDGASEKHLSRLRQILDENILSPEWLLPPDQVDRLLSETRDRDRRDRLIAMKLLARQRVSATSPETR